MPYINPDTVCSPKNLVSDVEVLYDTGPAVGSWSIARLRWDNRPRIAMRWNGEAESGIGLPQSRGVPTWFVLPEEVSEAVLKAAEDLRDRHGDAMLQGYQEMAADREREEEAERWSEAMIGDTLAAR